MKLLSIPKYKKFRQKSLKQIEDLVPEDTEFYDGSLIPENYTIILTLKEKDQNKLEKLTAEIKSIDANHFFVPSNKIHITILGMIDAKTNTTRVVESINEIELDNLHFHLFGMGSNRWSASVTTYPYFDLGSLRTNLESKLQTRADNYKAHLDEYHYMGWINILRYTSEPTQKLFDFIMDQQDRDWGVCVPESIQLFKNSSRVLEGAKLLYERKL